MLEPRKRTIVRASDGGRYGRSSAAGSRKSPQIAVMERLRIGIQQLAAAGGEDAGIDVDRKKVERRLAIEDGVDEMPRLARAAAAQLGEADVRSERGRNLRRLRPQNLVLGARDVVLRQLADRRKERRAERVIEVMREQELRTGREPSADILGEGAGGKGERAMQYETLARRTRRVDGERWCPCGREL